MPPGNRLEKLAADRAGQHSVRIKRQWRICFRWTNAGPEDMEITDYHYVKLGETMAAGVPPVGPSGTRQPTRLLSVMGLSAMVVERVVEREPGHRVHAGHCEHRSGLSVQAERPERPTVLMVRRRSTVRFRKGTPRSLCFFEISSRPICRFRGTGRRDALLLTLLRLITPDGH